MTAEDQRARRLHRLERLYIRAPIYFVTACTHERKAILANADVHDAFVEFAKAGEQHGAWVGAYVLMPDHLHLFVALDAERVMLDGWMKSLKNAVSKTLNSTGVLAPHWQKGFFDHVLRSGESYGEKWHYVQNNPVRAGFVDEPEKWPFAGDIFRLEYMSDR